MHIIAGLILVLILIGIIVWGIDLLVFLFIWLLIISAGIALASVTIWALWLLVSFLCRRAAEIVRALTKVGVQEIDHWRERRKEQLRQQAEAEGVKI